LADFGIETRRLMELRGYSLRGLARAVPCDPSDLSKILRGIKRPSPWQMNRIDDILDADGSIRDAEIATPARRPGLPRRTLSGRDADAILDTMRTFRDLDNRAGGGHAHVLAAVYLDTVVTPMLRHGTYSEAAGIRLFGAAAQLALLAAWSAYDNSDSKRTEWYLARSLELAAAAGDDAFTGEILAARSHRAIHLGHPDRAVELARAARHAAAGAGVPLLLAEVHELEANGHALVGDKTACAKSLAACDREFIRAPDFSAPPWLRYFDAPYLAARFAHTCRDLGDWRRAQEYACEAAAMSTGLARARAFNMLVLATAYVQSDRDEAIGNGRDALAMTADIQSSRAGVYTRDLRKRLRRRYGSGDPQVEAFEEECRELLGS
jgi:Helix-turn-helix domain